MRNDKLQVLTQGVRGGKKHVNVQGMVKICVLKGFNEPQDSITVDTFSGHLKPEPMETAAIHIVFQNGLEFNGTFRDLQARLWPEKYIQILHYCQDPDNAERLGITIGDKISERVMQILAEYGRG